MNSKLTEVDLAALPQRGTGPITELRQIIDDEHEYRVLRRFARTADVINRFDWSLEEFDRRNEWEQIAPNETLRTLKQARAAVREARASEPSIPLHYREYLVVKRVIVGEIVRSFDGNTWHTYAADQDK